MDPTCEVRGCRVGGACKGSVGSVVEPSVGLKSDLLLFKGIAQATAARKAEKIMKDFMVGDAGC